MFPSFIFLLDCLGVVELTIAATAVDDDELTRLVWRGGRVFDGLISKTNGN